MKVLAIDDNKDNLTTLKAILRDALPACTLLTALNGPRGLELALAEDPDVILLDIVMPGMDGYEVCRRLKADEQSRPIPVVFLTATRTDRDARILALENGAEGFLAKPLDEQELVAEVRAMTKVKAATLTQRDESTHLAALVAERTQALQQSERSLLNSLEDMRAENAARQQAEAEAQREQVLSNTIIDSIPGTFYLLDENGRYVRSNTYQREVVLGKPEEQIAGMAAIDTIHPEDRALIQARIANVLRDGKEESVESRVLLHGGPAFIWMLMTGRRMMIAGRPFLVGTGVDITERKQAEESLRAVEAKQSKMVANIGDVIVIIDAAGINRYKSPNVERWFGWRSDELVGVGALDNVHPEDLDHAQKFIGALRDQPNAFGTTECRYRCKNGSYKWIEFSGTNLLHDPDIQGVLGNYHDITERKQAEAEYAKLQTQFTQAQKMEAVGRLAGGVAHDFNNLLMGIMGYTQLCLDKIGPDHPIREWLVDINKEAERSAHLTHQLLAFARKQIIVPRVLDINNAIESMLKLLRRLIGEDIKVRWTPTSGTWPVKMDPVQIDQILANLAVNARDAIGGVGTITIGTDNATLDQSYCSGHTGSVPGDYVLLTVSDTGCGMDRETLAHIFEPFFTTKGVGEGTGLGLATVYGIVKQNNGFVDVYSEPGKGTTFKIYLPRFVTSETAPLVIEKLTTPPRGNETILLVEDEKSVRITTQTFLEDLGYTMLVADDPEKALSVVAEHPGEIHLLITDVIMPGMSGRDLANRLTKLRPTIRHLFISGFTADVIAQRGILDEGVNFLSKPFGRDTLARKVREVLEA